MAGAITRFTGSMPFVYLHLVMFRGWIAANLPGTPWPKCDPSFVVLAIAASVEAIFLSMFVLISQNRTAARAKRRADLDLQISLLSEREITRLITLVKALAEHHGVESAHQPRAAGTEMRCGAEKVLDALEAHEDSSSRSTR